MFSFFEDAANACAAALEECLPEIAGGIAFFALLLAGLFAVGLSDGFDATIIGWRG